MGRWRRRPKEPGADDVGQLVEESREAVWRLCLSVLRDRDLAEDAFQATYERALSRLDQYEGRAAWSTWVHRIAVNVCMNLLREQRTQRYTTLAPKAPRAAESSSAWETEEVRKIVFEDALAKLPPELRAALFLVVQLGYSYEEAAEILEVPAGTVKSRVFRAKKKFVAALASESVKAGDEDGL